MAESQIKITADTRQAERAIANLEGALEGLNRTTDLVGKALAVFTAAGAGIAVAFKSVADSVGELADLGKALGMTAQQLGYLQQSAQLAGVGADELNAALFRLRGNIGEALLKGSGAASDAIKRLNLNVETLSTLPADQQIEQITAALREIPNPAEQSALAIDLLGKQGPRLLEVADNAKRLKEEAKEMGIALDALDVRNLEKAGDAIDALSFIAKGILKSAMAELAPYIVAISEHLQQAAKEGGGIGNIIRERVLPAIKLATQAMAVLATFFVAAKIAAMAVAAYNLYQNLKLAALAGGRLNAVLGKNPLIKLGGLVLGAFAADKVIDEIDSTFDALDKKAEEIRNKTSNEIARETGQRNEVTEAAKRLNEEQNKILKALEQNIVKLEQSVAFEREKLDLGETQANINKMIREESEKLAEVGLKMTTQQKERITAAYLELEAVKQRASIEKTIQEQQTRIVTALVEDKNQREIILAIRAKELEFGRELTQQEQEKLTAVIQTAQAIEYQAAVNKALKDLEQERILLTIEDVKQREIQSQIMKLQNQLGRDLTENDRQRLQEQLKINQALKEEDAIKQAITNATRDQTELEKIQRGLSLQRTLGGGAFGGVTSQREYQKDLEALQSLLDRKIISEQDYYQQREELARAFNEKVQQLELQRIERTLMAEKSGIAAVISEQDRAVLQRIGEQERQRAIVRERIEFEKKSELQKAQFLIQQGAEIFNALGAQNKKAFEAAKAFNMANAIMNTYMAATKALATYPWPFGMVAAAAAVAAGLAQVAQIRSQQYSGRQLGGPVMGNKSYIVGENGPELFTPTTNGNITRNNQMGGSAPVTVNFNITANDAQGFDQLLYSRRGMITQIISDAMMEKGRRSIV